MKCARRGYGSLEYAILIVLVVSVLLTMGHYIKHAMAGRLSSLAEQLGEVYVPGRTRSLDAMVVRFKQQERFSSTNQFGGEQWGWAAALDDEVQALNDEADRLRREAEKDRRINESKSVTMVFVQTNVDKVDHLHTTQTVDEDLGKEITER